MTYHTGWTPELVDALAAPFPPEAHKEKKQGGARITFVDVHRYEDRLNGTVGPQGWGSAVRFDVVGGKLISTVSLTVLGVTKENVGDEVEVPELNERGNEKIIGSPATNSYAQAFKRACSGFGLGAYLYDESKREAAKRGVAEAADNGTRATLAGLVEKLEGVGLNGGHGKVLERAKVLATQGGSASKVTAAIEWAKGVISELEGATA